MQTKSAKPQKSPQVVNHDGLEGAGVLAGLGLSERQARVYLTLLKAGAGKPRAVGCAAGVPRQEAYRLLLEL